VTTVRIDRVLLGSPHRVWHALTRPDALAAWFWPEHFDTTVTVDLRAGGQYRIAAGSPAMAVSGRYREVTPPKRLVFTWHWDGDDAESLVTIDLVDLGETTGLSLRHELLADSQTGADHAQGWSDCLDRLPSWLPAVASG
jgi:uncharacterized protein YndB with AHSA1/START domain